MRSTVNIKGHAVHPMLIGLPLTFLPSAFICDVVVAWGGPEGWSVAARYLSVAGLVTALPAAVTGMIDYLHAVPPRSSARKRGTKHMLVNLTAVLAFAIAWWPRVSQPESGLWIIVLLELIGVVCLMIGGWLGGTLVQRNHIGVEHRYANAGRWQELTLENVTVDEIPVARLDELEVDQMKLMRINGQRYVLARTEAGYVAFDDRCTHKGGSLADSVCMGGKVQCLWHGSQFNIHDGSVQAGPATDPIRTFALREQNGEIILDLRPLKGG